jgi:hypothetical protein
LINPAPQAAKVAGTEAAIVADPELSEQEKQILVGLYRQFRGAAPVTSAKSQLDRLPAERKNLMSSAAEQYPPE